MRADKRKSVDIQPRQYRKQSYTSATVLIVHVSVRANTQCQSMYLGDMVGEMLEKNLNVGRRITRTSTLNEIARLKVLVCTSTCQC